MKITICDDSIKDLLIIEKLLLKYTALHPGNNLEVEKFSDPSRLCQKISKGKLSDIYILDMLMPGQTGIDLGNLIKSSGNGSVVIFITASEDYALDAYEVHAARYLLKPISENKLFEALDYAMSYTKAKTESVCLVKTKSGLVQMPYSKIEYIENANRRLEVHLSNREVLKSLFIRKSFEEEIKEAAVQKNFLRIHKSFLVNLNYVRQLTPDSMIMKSGRQLPVSKSRAAKVKREYLIFVSENIGG